jgi:thymidylate synthase
MNQLDKSYKALLQDILDNGTIKKDRTGTGTISVFGRTIRHKMSDGFPLLTTKKMGFKGIKTELCWFLKGSTNIKYLVENGCNIWNGDAYKKYVTLCSDNSSTWNTWMRYSDLTEEYRMYTFEEFVLLIKTDSEFASKWGDLGPIYGKQWRNWVAWETDDNFKQKLDSHLNYYDQLKNLISDLKTNPDSRRLMVNSWNVGEIHRMALPPCHYSFQCYTRDLTYDERYRYWFNNNYQTGMEYNPEEIPDFDNLYYSLTPTKAISLKWNQRSVDTFLGLPFNIASYGLLLTLLGKECNMMPDELIGDLGDIHLYLNHIEQAKKQIKLQEFNLPAIELPDEIDILNGEIGEVKLLSYISHPKISAPLSN